MILLLGRDIIAMLKNIVGGEIEEYTKLQGFINILGNPNVGKSTLMNCLVGENLSIITPKVQTTRHRILGILNNANYQLIFSDTPGIIEPKYELQSSMMDFVKNSFDDADIIIYMVEVGDRLKNNADIHNRLLKLKIPLIILLNKIAVSYTHLTLPTNC